MSNLLQHGKAAGIALKYLLHGGGPAVGNEPYTGWQNALSRHAKTVFKKVLGAVPRG